MNQYELHRAAEEDLYVAAAFYDNRLPGLGTDFLHLFERASARPQKSSRARERATAEILTNPLACQRWPNVWPNIAPEFAIRRKLLVRFPYGVPYMRVDERVIVLAVAHLSRQPAYWLDRARAYWP